MTIDIGASSDSAQQKIDKFVSSLKKLKSTRIRVDSKDVDKARKSVAGLGKVLSSLQRIAFYRVIRGAIKAVTQAFQEGAENAYWYSKTIGDQTKYIADAYDNLSSGSFKMSNQLGAAWATLKATLEPILMAIINLVTQAANAITQLFAILGGRTTYLKAIDYSKEWADTTAKGAGAAKEWKNQLMGFDEINRLEEPSSGGGGGGAALSDYGNMFRDAPISGFAQSVKNAIEAGDWQGVGTLLGEKINSIFPSASQWKVWGIKIGSGAKGIINSAYYALKATDFSMMGERVAGLINYALMSALSSTGGGSAARNLGALIVRRITAGLDYTISLLENLDLGLVGRAIGDFFRGAFDEAAGWIASYDWRQVAIIFSQKIKDLFNGIDPQSLGESVGNFVRNLFVGLGDFINGADWGGVAKSLGNFVSSAIAGINLGEVLASILYFAESVVWEIPGLLLEILSELSDTIADFFSDIGEESVAGWFRGISEKLSNAAAWLKENFVDPIVQNVRSLLGIHSPSTVFAEIGQQIVQGLWDGIAEKWNSFIGFFEGLWSDLASWWSGLSLGAFHIPVPHFEWTYSEASGAIARALEFVGLPSTIPHLNISWFARGGFPTSGQLFMAREAGPELVGTVGGRTAVANNDQIVEGIKEGVFEAVTSAMGGSGQAVEIYLDGRQIASTTTKYQRQFARANG